MRAECVRGDEVTLAAFTEALSHAVEAYRRTVFLEGLANEFAALRADGGSAWSDEEAERTAWDSTSADGLPDE